MGSLPLLEFHFIFPRLGVSQEHIFSFQLNEGGRRWPPWINCNHVDFYEKLDFAFRVLCSCFPSLILWLLDLEALLNPWWIFCSWDSFLGPVVWFVSVAILVCTCQCSSSSPVQVPCRFPSAVTDFVFLRLFSWPSLISLMRQCDRTTQEGVRRQDQLERFLVKWEHNQHTSVQHHILKFMLKLLQLRFTY
jgi:hypothetical protein